MVKHFGSKSGEGENRRKMSVVALCVGSIFHREKFARADHIVRREIAEGNHVILIPCGIAKLAMRPGEDLDYLYFLNGGIADCCKALRGETIDDRTAELLQKKMESYGLPFEQITPEEIDREAAPAGSNVQDWQGELFVGNEALAHYIFDFTNRFLDADRVEDISKAMESYLPEGTFLCIRDTFLQNLYADREMQPGKHEKFYILADRRKEPKTWESYELCNLFPGAKKAMKKPGLTVVLPVQSKKAYFGYLVYEADGIDRTAGTLEQCSILLDLTIGRYITERQLLFASHELVSANENVRKLQETDVLTGLLNSQGFMTDAEKLLVKARMSGQRISAVCIDLDRLGNINDVYGHMEGDAAIQTLSKIIQDSLHVGTVAARLGSDEFILLNLLNPGEEQNVELYFKSLRNRVENYNLVSNKEYTLDINYSSIVVDVHSTTTVSDVLDEAFAKKRHIKESRGSRRNIVNYEDDEENAEEHQLVTETIDSGDFRYAFQPIISTHTGEVVAYEALMRTSRDIHLSPLTILKYAAKDDRLYDIELATFTNVFAIMERWEEELGTRKVFINSIPGHYLDEADYQRLKRKYAKYYPNLVVEITEQTNFENDTVELLRERSSQGHFEVAVDDFGTGYSNLANLLKFLPNYVKIDRALIEGVQEDPKKQHFVKNIIEFAHDNGFQALAEGVECTEELVAVVRMGIDLIQGYYTARPDFALTTTLSQTIRDEIVRANFEGAHDQKKKVYLVNREKELFLMHLAMERYTGLIISQESLTIHGNPDFMAGITIKIKEKTECTLTICNVCLGDVDDLPIIDVGAGAKLTLVVEGNNFLEGNGIHVPEGASVKLVGEGSLRINPVLAEAYGIGADADSVFGGIECAMDGVLSISVEGNRCIAIGGGCCRSADGILVSAGKLDMMLVGTSCVGIGAYNGNVPIRISDCNLRMDAQVSAGLQIGSLSGTQDIMIHDVAMHLTGSGSMLAGIGSYEDTNGRIVIRDASLRERYNGKRIYMLGAPGGMLDITMQRMDVDMLAEGNQALGVGTTDMKAKLRLLQSRFYVVMRAGNCTAVGVEKDRLEVEGGTNRILVNENEVALDKTE